MREKNSRDRDKVTSGVARNGELDQGGSDRIPSRSGNLTEKGSEGRVCLWTQLNHPFYYETKQTRGETDNKKLCKKVTKTKEVRRVTGRR